MITQLTIDVRFYKRAWQKPEIVRSANTPYYPPYTLYRFGPVTVLVATGKVGE